MAPVVAVVVIVFMFAWLILLWERVWREELGLWSGREFALWFDAGRLSQLLAIVVSEEIGLVWKVWRVEWCGWRGLWAAVRVGWEGLAVVAGMVMMAMVVVTAGANRRATGETRARIAAGVFFFFVVVIAVWEGVVE
jgi:hypothetical protein